MESSNKEKLQNYFEYLLEQGKQCDQAFVEPITKAIATVYSLLIASCGY